jgi:hypothetical protein
MSYHQLPDKTPSGSDVIRTTVGLPGFNVVIPIASKERLHLAIGLSVLAGLAGGSLLAYFLNKK